MFKKYIEKIVRNEIAYMKENEKQDKKRYENSEIYALETENSSLKKEIDKLTFRNNDLKEQVISNEKKLEKLKSNNDNLEYEISDLNNKNDSLKHCHDEYFNLSEILKEKNDSLKRWKNEYSKSFDNLTKDYMELKQKNIHYTNENFDLKNQIISLQKELEKLKVVPEIAKFNVKPIYSEYSKNEYLHQSQIAKRFGYAESTISYWVKKGKLKPRGFKNKRIIFCVAEVERDLKAIGKFKGIIGTD
jgi:chromosome segregation ATPase